MKCKVCGEPTKQFFSSGKFAKICPGVECKHKARHLPSSDLAYRLEAPCQTCGRAFKRKPGPGKCRLHCNDACRRHCEYEKHNAALKAALDDSPAPLCACGDPVKRALSTGRFWKTCGRKLCRDVRDAIRSSSEEAKARNREKEASRRLTQQIQAISLIARIGNECDPLVAAAIAAETQKKAKRKKYYDDNRERINAWMRASRATHRDRYLASERIRNRKRRDAMKSKQPTSLSSCLANGEQNHWSFTPHAPQSPHAPTAPTSTTPLGPCQGL